MQKTIYQNQSLRIVSKHFEIPWLIIYMQDQEIKEFTQCSNALQMEILRAINIIERNMIRYFKPDKINIALFGNYHPHLHVHIQARFANDSYFPEPTWGTKQREPSGRLYEDDVYELFINNLKKELEQA